MAMGIASDMVTGKGRELYEANKGWFSLDWIKVYFDVTNRYVLNKLRIIILPFTLKQEDWRRQGLSYEYSAEGTPATPREDLQAPDLYIPLMSFVTFILLVGCFRAYEANTYETQFDME